MRAHTHMDPIFCVLLLLVPGALSDVSTVKDLAVLEGRSVTIPCHYDPQYTRHVKYWCRGMLKDFCSSLARTDNPSPADGKVTITDDPVQRVFTVIMRDLQEGDSGWYWCGVEVGGIWRADDTVSIHITVTHGMSVVNSMVVGEEGGSVSIECLYGYRHRDSVKMWCRAGDWSSCVATDSNGTLEGVSVLISDDHKGAFTVTVRALELTDEGWYWCAAGQQQVSVHITVAPRSVTQRITTTGTSLPTIPPSSPESSSPPNETVEADKETSNTYSNPVLRSPLMICGALLLLALVVMVPWNVWRHCKRTHRGRSMDEIEATLAPHPDCETNQTKTSILFTNTSCQQVHMF